MSWQTLLTFVTTCFLTSMIPGPNMLFAMGVGLRQGVRGAVWAGAGMCAALAAMATLSALGVAALLQTSHTAFLVVKWGGVAYLAWLGIQAWRAEPDAAPSDEGEARAQAAPAGAVGLFARGVVVCGSNPKALLFLGAFFPQFIDTARPVAGQLLLLVGMMLVIEFGWVMAYALGGRTLADRLRSPRAARRLNRLTGGVLIGAGGLLAALR